MQTNGLLTLVSVLALASPARAADLPLEELLELAGEYVVGYEAEFSLIVVEEEYRQQLRYQRGGLPEEKRSLRSDVLFIRGPGDAGWMGFRDVFKVDGKSTRDREARLQKLFLLSPQQAPARARAILRESARLNLGATRREFNVPTTPLLFLHPSNQHRFAFQVKGSKKVEGRRCQVLEYEETTQPSLVREGRGGGEVVARGKLFVNQEDGAVLKSELAFDPSSFDGRVRIEVSYRWIDELGLWLPHEMRETYEARKPKYTGAFAGGAYAPQQVEYLDCRAKYKNHERFVPSP
jgi:hypothetical protein